MHTPSFQIVCIFATPWEVALRAGRLAHFMFLLLPAWSGDALAAGATILAIFGIHCFSEIRCRVFNIVLSIALIHECSPIIAIVLALFTLIFSLFGPKKPGDRRRNLLMAATKSQKSWQATLRAEKVAGVLRCVYLGQESRGHPGQYEPDPAKFDVIPGERWSQTKVMFMWTLSSG